MLSGKTILIEQAHSSAVTGVVHFTNQIVLSGSKDGLIRVWKVDGQKATLDNQSSSHLLKTYSTGKNIQILFLDLSIVQGQKLLSAGTNDNRVLFFSGDQLQYNPLNLSERNALIYKIQYGIAGQIPFALLLTWSADKTSSTVVSVLLTDFSVVEVATNDAKQNPRNNILLIEIIQQKLFVATIAGVVTIYSLPQMQKVGAMLHRNTVNSILGAEYLTKTQIKIPQIFVLQSRYNQKPGSIGVYNFKK